MQETLKKLEAFERTWETKTLPNGAQLIHIPSPNDSLELHLSAIFHVGSKDEPKKLAGISHFLEHMLFRGSKQYPSFLSLANAFEWLGSEWNGATGHEYTEYTFSGMIRHLDQALELFADFIQHPSLCDLERERQIILREIDDDLNEYGLSMDMDQHCKNLFWPDSSLSQPILGTDKTVSKISLAALTAHREEHYHAGNLSLAIVGGSQNDRLFAQTEALFANLPKTSNRATPPPTQTQDKVFTGPRCSWVRNSDNQYHICLAFECEGEWSEKAHLYTLISSILSEGYLSRLPLRLREELGLVYDVDMQCHLHSRVGTINISVSVLEENIEKSVREIAKILRDFARLGPTEDELAKAKLRAEVDISRSYLDVEGIGFRVAWCERYGKCPKLSTEYKNIMNSETLNLKEIARATFQPRNCGMILMGSEKKHYQSSLPSILQDELSL